MTTSTKMQMQLDADVHAWLLELKKSMRLHSLSDVVLFLLEENAGRGQRGRKMGRVETSTGGGR